jgi:hypothetical protein
MILRELFYFNRETANTEQDDRFMAYRDSDVIELEDTRKTKLTLGQINELRRSSDQHIKETQAEMDFIARMYAAPPAEAV